MSAKKRKRKRKQCRFIDLISFEKEMQDFFSCHMEHRCLKIMIVYRKKCPISAEEYALHSIMW